MRLPFFMLFCSNAIAKRKIIMQIIEVNNAATRKSFLDLARKIYQNDPNWICPLNNDIESVFDPRRNSNHQNGKCIRWILKDNSDKVIGRIAAFINDKKAYLSDLPVGGAALNVPTDAADLLFDTAKLACPKRHERQWINDQLGKMICG